MDNRRGYVDVIVAVFCRHIREQLYKRHCSVCHPGAEYAPVVHVRWRRLQLHTDDRALGTSLAVPLRFLPECRHRAIGGLSGPTASIRLYLLKSARHMTTWPATYNRGVSHRRNKSDIGLSTQIKSLASNLM